MKSDKRQKQQYSSVVQQWVEEEKKTFSHTHRPKTCVIGTIEKLKCFVSGNLKARNEQMFCCESSMLNVIVTLLGFGLHKNVKYQQLFLATYCIIFSMFLRDKMCACVIVDTSIQHVMIMIELRKFSAIIVIVRSTMKCNSHLATVQVDKSKRANLSIGLLVGLAWTSHAHQQLGTSARYSKKHHWSALHTLDLIPIIFQTPKIKWNQLRRWPLGQK